MKRPNDRELEALASLHHNKDFTGWLQASLDACQETLVLQQDETLLRQAQGEGRTLREILKLIADAPNIIQRKA
jgi:hypothetical protein